MPLEGVAPEIVARLRLYHELLLKWQKTVNLVGPATLGAAWDRHFVDSAQVAGLLPDGARVLYDLGSGAGFPGLVLAMMRPEMDVHLVESDQRKAMFLRTVSRETGCAVTVHDCRIEDLPDGVVPDVVSARALAALPQLMAWCLKWAEAKPEMVMILPKGEKAAAEIEAARGRYEFAVAQFPSVTAPEARILRVTGLRAKGV